MEEVAKPTLLKEVGFKEGSSGKRYKFGLYLCNYCGNTWEARISSIKEGIIRGCGCLIGKRHTHGLSTHMFYGTWYDMIRRCTNTKRKDYKHYGGRGISVCEEWKDVKNFVEWAESTYIEDMTLDRIDVEGNYEPINCTWSDMSTQNINKRMVNTNTSGYSGVTWHKNVKRWLASLTFKGVKTHIGCFNTIEEAVEARDNYIISNNLPHKLSKDYVKKEIE